MRLEHIYAKALAKNATKASDVDGLIAHLKSRGRLKLLPGILRELKSMQERTRQLGGVLEVAREEDKAHAKKEAGELGIDAHTVHINHSLIRGWRARENGKLIDRSGKRALVDLYRQIIK